MILPNFFRKIRLLMLLTVMPIAGLHAASESYVQSLTGHLKKGDSLTVIDDKFLNLPLDQWNQLKHLSIDDIVTFELRRDTALKFYTQKFSCTLNVTIKYFTSRDQQTPTEIDSVNLVVRYDTTRGASYPDVAHYRFKNAFKVTVIINSINSPEWKDKLPDVFRLKSQIVVERKYPFNPQGNGKLHLGMLRPADMQDMVAAAGPDQAAAPLPWTLPDVVCEQLPISWDPSAFTGAEEFDVEWTFVDKLSARGQAILNNYGSPRFYTIPQDVETQWMSHDATRVTVTSTPYTISLPYMDGFVLMRIRSVYFDPTTNVRETGPWVYTQDNGYTAAQEICAYQSNLNWQYTGEFAEEGKRKEVITYFDGTQRDRQSVTINNSDLTYKSDGSLSPTAVVQETIYDIMGRPTVKVMPAPVKSNLLDYIPSFNQNSSNNPFSFSDINLNVTSSAPNSCTIAADQMSTSSGASQYYSSNNSFLDAQNLPNYYFNPYIPDAQKYPYSLTAYTPDNTGRISQQGGVGAALQVGGVHSTQYYYTKPSQKSLQRIFGMEVGDALHYFKNVTIDPNGQTSVSYLDAHGRTIATALGGGSPGNMDALPSNTPAADTRVTDVLIEPTNFIVDAGSLTMTATSSFLAETTDPINVVCTVNPLALVTPYASGASQLCNNCYYNVVVRITDACGTQVSASNSTPFQPNDYTCYVNPPPVTIPLNFTPAIGAYTITYSLELSNDVINAQTNYYVQHNTDLSTIQNFFIQELNNMNLSGCYSSCTACQTLGSTVDQFRANVLNQLGMSSFAGITVGSGSNDPIQLWITNTWTALKAQCAAISCLPPSPCDQKLTELEQDVLPGGQYALYDPVALANNEPIVFLQPQINVMEYYNTDPTISATTFIASDGSTQQIGNLSQADFVRAYLQNPQWASMFVVHHIEYCSYLWCKDASNPTPADNNEVSYTFDANLQQNYTSGSAAVSAGYYNHSDPLALLKLDPWFNGGRGTAYYANMQSDLMNLTTVLNVNMMDNTVSPAAPLPAKNIILWIDWMLYCKPPSNATAAQVTASWQSCTPNDACRSVTMEWTTYLNYYMQLKSKYYRVAKLVYNPSCTDCFIGGDALAAANCVPPGAQSNYTVAERFENSAYNFYIVYNGGNSPFLGAYTFTYDLRSNVFGSGNPILIGPATVTANAGDMQVLIGSYPVLRGQTFDPFGYYEVLNVGCTPSALATCAANSPSGGSSAPCPPSSAYPYINTDPQCFTDQLGDQNCTYEAYLVYPAGNYQPVTVDVYQQTTNLDPNNPGQPGAGTNTFFNTYTISPGQSIDVGPGFAYVTVSNTGSTSYSQYSIQQYSVGSLVTCVQPPPPSPASTCTSNPNYMYYIGKARVFNDYTDFQDYSSCEVSSYGSGTQAAATAAMLADEVANLMTQKNNWLAMLQNVRNQTTAFQNQTALSDANLLTLVNDLYQVSYTYLQIASAQGTALNIVSSLPSPLPSGFTAPSGYMSFGDVFNALIPASVIQQGFSADLLGNVYPYNKTPYLADPNVVSLTADIYSNVVANLTAFQNAYNRSGSSAGFYSWLQQQLGDDFLLTSAQLSDLQARIAGGCTNPYLADPAILPVAFVVTPGSSSGSIGASAAPPSFITCSQLNSLIASVQSTYPGLPTSTTDLLYQTIYTNYLNHQLGYALDFDDYQGYVTQCSGSSTAYLYDKPESPTPPTPDPFTCVADQLQQTYSKAGQDYTIYITQIKINFRSAYISKCLSNQASATMTANQYEYHYTLYYYDQSGNLVKTIPPEGVRLLTDQDISTIQQTATQTASSCTAVPSNVIYSQPTILGDLSTGLQNNSVDAMEMWLFTNSGGNTRDLRMVTPDNQYMVQAAIANGDLWFEVYSLQPNSTGVSMVLTNEAVAAMPPELALQNWTHLMVQSSGGLAGGTLTLYVNGNKLTNLPAASAPGYPFDWEIDGTTGGFVLPQSDVSEIQHLRLYQQPASDAQVLADYQNACLAPVGALATSYSYWAIFNGPTFCNNNTANSTPVTIPDRGSLTISSNPDPTGSLTEFSLTNVVNTFTVEFWVNPQTSYTITNLNDIFAGVDYSPPYAIFPQYGGTAASGHANMGVAVGTNGITVFEHADSYLPVLLDWRGSLTGWTHVAVVYNNLTPSLYVNAVYQKTGNTSTKSTVSPSYNFGGGAYGYMPGGIDEVRIWNIARTPAQIAAAYTQALGASDQSGLVGYWPMDNTDGSMIHDISCNGNDATFHAPAMSWATTGAPITETNYVPFAQQLIVPNHGLPTNYVYNSLNQVVQQVTPDWGTTTFLYDRLGRLSVTQNSEQLQPAVVDVNNVAGRFSYTRYDALGRVTEVGEKLGAATLAETDARTDATLQAWYASGSNQQVTITAYDAAPSWAPTGIQQDNLRKRVSASALLSAGSDPTQNRLSASYFSYDFDGNVAEQVQENAALVAAEKQFVTGSTGLKDIKYQYELISGKVNEVLYQDGKWDQFYYQYIYDADNRVVNAYSSRNNYSDISLWTNEAIYRYYLHGPLARMELGNNATGSQGVQGVDYAYTLQGWMKGVNGQQVPGPANTRTDMSGDGVSGTTFGQFAQDVLGYSLGYYHGDYLPIGGSGANAFSTPYQASSGLPSGVDLFSGNIGSASYAIVPFAAVGSTSGFSGYTYRYDQLNRLTKMDHHTVGPYLGTGSWTSSNFSADYGEKVGYDGNGNILTYQRSGTLTLGMMDDLNYFYTRDANGNLLNNKLGYINDNIGNGVYPNDLDAQAPGNYTYNNIGSLIGDNTQSITQMNWTVYGKLASISKGGVQSGVQGLNFGYDPGGNRITKTVTASSGTTATYYVRDATGNVLGVYQYKGNSAGTLTEGDWVEQHLYGGDRLGMLMPHVVIPAGQVLVSDAYNPNTDQTENTGNHLYELTNHLGNVILTLNDVVNPPGVGGNTGVANAATVVSAQDYYPFGMEMPGRTYLAGWSTSPNYRFGFNGKENDNEIEGIGNQIDYGARIYDPRVGRFYSVDPYIKRYPFFSSYQYAGNSPIAASDLDGFEPVGRVGNGTFNNSYQYMSGRGRFETNMGKDHVDGTLFRVNDALGVSYWVLERSKLEYYTDNLLGVQQSALKEEYFYFSKPPGPHPEGGMWIPYETENEIASKQSASVANGIGVGFYGLITAPFAYGAAAGTYSAYLGTTFATTYLGRGLVNGLWDFCAQLGTNGGHISKVNITEIGASVALPGGNLWSLFAKNAVGNFAEWTPEEGYKGIGSAGFDATTFQNDFYKTVVGTAADKGFEFLKTMKTANSAQLGRWTNLSYKAKFADMLKKNAGKLNLKSFLNAPSGLFLGSATPLMINTIFSPDASQTNNSQPKQ